MRQQNVKPILKLETRILQTLTDEQMTALLVRKPKGFVGCMVSDQQFTVGAAHVIVNALVGELRRPIVTDATNDSSRYVFRSLGFLPRSGKKPRLLALG